MNRVALVTGASRGIGRAIAAELAEAGHAVCINYLTHRQEAETLAEKIRNHGGNAIAVQADVADRAAVEAMVRTAEAELGPVSLLVNNAGIAGQIQFQDITDAQWNRYLGVNLGGARNTIQAVLPHMLHEKAGCIVNISSIWGLRGASCEVAYACTKAALVGLTRSLALELAPSHIRVNCVAPGVINTDMVQVLGQETLRDLAEQTPLGRLGTPEDVAHAVAFLASDKASFLTGQILAEHWRRITGRRRGPVQGNDPGLLLRGCGFLLTGPQRLHHRLDALPPQGREGAILLQQLPLPLSQDVRAAAKAVLKQGVGVRLQTVEQPEHHLLLREADTGLVVADSGRRDAQPIRQLGAGESQLLPTGFDPVSKCHGSHPFRCS